MSSIHRARLLSKHVNRAFEPLSYLVGPEQFRAIVELNRFYNPTGGPVRKLATYFASDGAYGVTVAHSSQSDLDLVIRKHTGMPSLETNIRESLFGGGKGASFNDTWLSTLGEGVERALGALVNLYGPDQLYGTRRELIERGFACLAPQDCPLFADEQYDDAAFYYQRFTDDSVLTWLPGHRLRSAEPILVPAQLIDLLHLGPPNEAQIGYGHSGGLSCHIDREHALFHGITELFERDAVNLRWYCGIPPEEIDLDVINRPDLRRLAHDLDRQPGRMRYLQHALDIPEIPVVTTVRYDDWLNSFAYTAGGGVDTDIEVAIVKALTEFGQSERTIKLALMSPERAVSRAVDEMFGIAPDSRLELLTLFVQVIGYYGHRANRSKFDWYLNENPVRPLSELPRDVETDMTVRLSRLETILDRHGIDPIVFDFTPPGCEQLVLFKVFIPEITQPFLQSKPMLGHPRFAEIAARFGNKPDFAFEDFIRDPLPYP
jgi:ribosomal protein S12 methylthiotransferase accessory factor